MPTFADRIKSLLPASRSAGAPSSRDPIDYDNAVHLDAEDLAEQGILSAYRALLPQLRKYARAAPIEVTEDIDDTTLHYVVHAGGKAYRIWGTAEWEQDGWERATVAFFAIVNANLEGAEVRFYALYGGNDLTGIFLTEEQFAAARRAIKEPWQRPWMPVYAPPHYGFPGQT